MKTRILIGSLSLFPEANLLALRGQMELSSKGLADSRMDLHGQWECVLVKICDPSTSGRDYVPAGLIAFTHDTPRALLWVQLSYVAEEYRGRGVYKLAYMALRTIAIARTCRSIEGATHIKNLAMRTVAKRMSRREEFVVLVDDVELKPENFMEGGSDV